MNTTFKYGERIIEKSKKIFSKRYGCPISKDQACEMLNNLVGLFNVLSDVYINNPEVIGPTGLAENL